MEGRKSKLEVRELHFARPGTCVCVFGHLVLCHLVLGVGGLEQGEIKKSH